MKLKTVITLRTAFIAAIVIAVVGFLLIDNYQPVRDVIGNIMRGEILVWKVCPPTDLIPPPPVGYVLDCNRIVLPYRWVLAVLAVFIAGAAILQRRKSN
jgi:hypothetical protein